MSAWVYWPLAAMVMLGLFSGFSLWLLPSLGITGTTSVLLGVLFGGLVGTIAVIVWDEVGS